MNLKYFLNCQTIEELKKKYRILTKKYHPDLNKDKDTTKIMQEVNSEYDYLLTRLPKNKKDNSSYTQAEALNDYFKEAINAIIHLDGLEIEIIGSWIWVGGNTYPYKDILKKNNFFWIKSRKMWAWNNGEGKKRIRTKRKPIEQLRAEYGSTKIEVNKVLQIA